MDGNAGVEADAVVSDDMRVVGEPRVFAGVFDDQRLSLGDDMRAERRRPLDLTGLDSDPRLVPLPVVVEERHDGRRHRQETLSEASDPVELLLLLGVEQPKGIERSLSMQLVARLGRDRHGSLYS